MTPGNVVANRFEMEAEAGAGGMGTVFRARDRDTGRVVALKMMTSADGDASRFAREAAVLGEVDHPAIVRYVAHGAGVKGPPWLAMEWLEGEDLGRRLARGVLSIDETLVLARRVAAALAETHRRGIVHRDMKPTNLFLVDGRVDDAKLLDFGIARPIARGAGLTRTGAAIGTPAYMAPEQARGERDVDARADVFSFGCVLYECLAGRSPFAGDHALAVLGKILLEDAAPIESHRADAPPALARLVAAMLTKDPARRPADGAAVMAALERWTVGGAAAPGESLLGFAEQRVVSIVLSGSVAATDDTADCTQQTTVEVDLRELTVALGGRFEALANGSMVAVFAGCGAPADEAARAAHCASAMSAALPGKPIAVAIGRAVVAGALPVGAALDDAADLLSRVRDGRGVFVQPAAAALLEERFELEVSPEGVSRLVGRAQSGDGERTLLGRRASFVGRERDLATLHAMVDECAREPVALAALIVAPPGMGKSRLLREVLGDLPRGSTQLIRARAESVAAGAPFALAAQLVWSAAGATEADAPPVRKAKIVEHVGGLGLGVEGPRVAAFLCEIAGATGADDVDDAVRAARADAVQMADAIRTAWVAWARALSARGTVVVALEDLHWGDAPTTLLIDASLRHLAAHPLLVLATARPEVHETFPGLWSQRGVQEIRLGPLSRRAAEALLNEVASGVSAAHRALVLDRAAGHPFFLEELIRAAAAGAVAALPDTVLGMVQIRLDALGADAKRVLRAASVFGEEFAAAAPASLSGSSLEAITAALDDLAVKEVLDARAPHASGARYAFRHALVRDVAYAMFTDADRRMAHRLAAEWLEATGAPDAPTLAEHLERGGEPARALPWLAIAAQQALDGGDFAGAARRAEHALTLEPTEPLRSTIEMALADAAFWLGDVPRAAAVATRVAERAEVGSRAWFRAVALAIEAHGQAGANAEVVAGWQKVSTTVARDQGALESQLVCLCKVLNQLAWVDAFSRGQGERHSPRVHARILEIAAATTSLAPEVEGWVLRVDGLFHALFHDDLETASELFERALVALDRAGALRVSCSVRAIAAALTSPIDLAHSRAQAERAVADAERLGSDLVLGIALHYAGTVLLASRAPAQAEIVLRRALTLLTNNQSLTMSARTVLAGALCDLGRSEEAVPLVDGFESLPGPFPLAALIRVRVETGRAADATRSIPSLDPFPRMGATTPWLVMLALASFDALSAVGRHGEAKALLLRAARALFDHVGTLRDPAHRKNLLETFHLVTRLVALAREHGAAADVVA